MAALTLVLNPWYVPYRVVAWRHAITWMCLDKVDLVVAYPEVVRSPSLELPLPAVIRMRRKVGAQSYKIRFSRMNVFFRDGFRCMYCGLSAPASELTLDHVLPRSRGGRTEWSNILTACTACNASKGNRTPEQAGMRPVRPPHVPKTLPLRRSRLSTATIPLEWRDFFGSDVGVPPEAAHNKAEVALEPQICFAER